MLKLSNTTAISVIHCCIAFFIMPTRESVIIRDLKTQVKALELKIEGSELNQKYLKADNMRSHWFSEYSKLEIENEKLKKKLIKKQKCIDKAKKNLIKIF